MNEDTQKLIGTILPDTAQRDAIHIAVVPLIAGEDLWASREIKLAYGTTNTALQSHAGEDAFGIVDPFLKAGVVKQGQRFYGFLFPNTVTGMRHHWQHPAFDNPAPAPTSADEAWLRQFAEKWNFDYDEMIEAAQMREGYVVARGIDLHSRAELESGDEAQFWHCIENLTGRRFDYDHRESFTWSCSC